MSGIMLNLTFDPFQRDKSDQSKGNAKHKRFVRKQHFVGSNGYSRGKQSNNNNNNNNEGRDKQINGQEQSNPGADFPKRNKRKKKKKQNTKQINGREQTKPGAVFPIFNTTLPVKTNEPSSSTQSRRPSTFVSSTACTSNKTPTQSMVLPAVGPFKYVALDCEMVGTGPKGNISELARCSIVSYDGDVIYDKFIQPIKPVTDFRTRWSGIRRQDLRNATPFRMAQAEIMKIMKGKVVVGHAIQNDYKALKYYHPACQTRDTARIPLLNQKAGFPEREVASLKRLTKALFNKDIQVGRTGHSSVEDAQATMELYKVVEVEWERHLASEAVKNE